VSAPVPERIIEPRRGLRKVDVAELFRYRDLLRFLVLRDIKVLYKQTVLGLGWAVLRPVLSMIVFSIVFGRLAKVPSDGIPYPLFSFAALVPWTYFQTAMVAASTSLIGGSRLISKIYFPRMLLPLTPVLAGLVDFAIAGAVLALLMLFYGAGPTTSIIVLPLLVVVMVLSAAGVGLWLAALAVQYRDVKFALPFVAQLMMYAAPVVWPASLIPHKYRLLYGLYPMAGVIEGFRSALFGRTAMPWDLIGMGTIAAVLLVTSGALVFRRTERFVADVA